MNLSNLLRFVLGLSLGMVLLLTGTISVARYLIEQFTVPPPKPLFAEELPSPPPDPTPDPTPVPTAALVPSPLPNPSPSPSPSPKPSPSPSPSPSRPPGQAAKVSWPEGLRIRDTPNVSAASVGGVEYNQDVVILETSADGNWQRIWSNGTEGWVKTGNLSTGN
ncbi:SH3 domain-containing protein [Prochlorothrix hollandica]|uniref:SH3 domain-containing protein n=1 Tax=Prochlorothrix hollandica TaxID=1223 RepID=UPI003342CCAE